MKNFRKQSLVCGCCGIGFDTRPTYKDQDQDKGYGICRGCQKSNRGTNAQRYNETFRMIRNSLKPENQAKCDAKLLEIGPKYKTILVNIALEKGRIKRSI